MKILSNKCFFSAGIGRILDKLDQCKEEGVGQVYDMEESMFNFLGTEEDA